MSSDAGCSIRINRSMPSCWLPLLRIVRQSKAKTGGFVEEKTWLKKLAGGLSSPQQRRTAGGLQALTGTVRSPRVAADWKVRAPVGVSRCALIRNFEHLA